MVRIIGLDLIINVPGPDGSTPTTTERLNQVVRNAVRFEELGFDGFAVGERHHAPFLSSAPPVILSHIAARTERIRLFTGVTLLSVLDPVRVAEDYATLDHLAGGRLELIVGKGNGPEQSELFGIGREEAWGTQHDNYRLLRSLWSGDPVDWQPPSAAPTIRRTPLHSAVVHPQPLQSDVRIWHGSSTSIETVELAAAYGDPIWVANAQKSVEGYQPLVERYRAAWAEAGHDPAGATVGAGFSVHVTKRSQDAVDAYRSQAERWIGTKDDFNAFDPDTLFRDYDDYLARSSALVGSPQQAIDKLSRYVEAYGFSAVSIPGHPGGIPENEWLDSLELFRTEVLPELERIAPGPERWDSAERSLATV